MCRRRTKEQRSLSSDRRTLVHTKAEARKIPRSSNPLSFYRCRCDEVLLKLRDFLSLVFVCLCSSYDTHSRLALPLLLPLVLHRPRHRRHNPPLPRPRMFLPFRFKGQPPASTLFVGDLPLKFDVVDILPLSLFLHALLLLIEFTPIRCFGSCSSPRSSSALAPASSSTPSSTRQSPNVVATSTTTDANGGVLTMTVTSTPAANNPTSSTLGNVLTITTSDSNGNSGVAVVTATATAVAAGAETSSAVAAGSDSAVVVTQTASGAQSAGTSAAVGAASSGSSTRVSTSTRSVATTGTVQSGGATSGALASIAPGGAKALVAVVAGLAVGAWAL